MIGEEEVKDNQKDQKTQMHKLVDDPDFSKFDETVRHFFKKEAMNVDSGKYMMQFGGIN